MKTTYAFLSLLSILSLLGCSQGTIEPCTPQCDGLQCGDNGCGGNCGLCEDPATCQDGQCVLPGECQPSCDITQCRVCFQYTCESLCHGSEVCNDGICEEPICDPPCDGNTRICSDSVCKTFAELKNEYLGSHPGQAIIPYPWEPITSTRILPFDYEVPAAPGNEVSLSACRNEFEPASFVLTAQKDLSGITLDVPNLSDAQGNTIPSSAIDVRLIKVWYQASEHPMDPGGGPKGYFLTPELLLKDDSLVGVDYVNQANYLKVTINDVEQTIDISSPTATVPPTAQIRDATTLQPFSLKTNENKQIWVTVHVPTNTLAGDYHGNITINAQSEAPVTMNFKVTVLPFDLEPAPIEYGLYYENDYSPGTIGYFYNDRNPASMRVELQDMKDHGVLYPTFYQNRDVGADIEGYLALRDTIGFPKDKIYLYGAGLTYLSNPSDAAGLAVVATKVNTMKSYAAAHGIQTIYFYGTDEATGTALTSQFPAWQVAHNNGAKIWAASWDVGLAPAITVCDTAVIAWDLLPTVAAQWHSYGHKILSYGNPQVGIENPEIYRKNYGAALWNAGYDGAMDFAYQSNFYGDIWNDFDNTWRDHIFAYPTTNGVVDTIQWEGWREGVDDTRYLATLISKMGNDTLARSIVADSLSKNESMSTIRKRLIKEILSH
jgi:hypothetical protein